VTSSPDPARPRAPAGVPRWLWPPPGATVRRVVLRERRLALEPRPSHDVLEGGPVEELHLRALVWLLDDHADDVAAPTSGDETRVVLEIARTEMAHGRVGHAYALDGGPLGAPRASAARGVVLRFLERALAP
jgi:hypothetical protein